MAFTLSYVSFYGNVPTAHSVDTIASADIPTLSYTGYDFDGWYYDTQYSSQAGVGDTLLSDTVLYAKWISGNQYLGTMGANTVLEYRGGTSTIVKYNGVDIGASPTQGHNLVLTTAGKLVEHQITLDEELIGIPNKVYTSNIILSATKVLSAPIIGIRGTNVYVLDTTDGGSDDIEVAVDETLIGSLYRINLDLENVSSDSSAYTFASSTLSTQIVIIPNTGYNLPSSITVTGAAYNWNSGSGILTISRPTDVVNVTIRGVAI